MATESRSVAVQQPGAAAPVNIGFGTLASFEFTQRAARALMQSTLVPEIFRQWTLNKQTKEMVENPNALSNCIIALNMADRMGADPLMIMQNLYVVEGRPSWSSQFVIACINACGRFSPLRFELSDFGEEREVTYERVVWVNRSRTVEKVKVKLRDRSCRAWVVEKATGDRLEGPLVTMEMAVVEGWFGKNGSKWQTMPEVMLRYRSASFFGRLYAPDLLMGLHTAEEAEDIIDVTASPASAQLAGPIPAAPTRAQFQETVTSTTDASEEGDPTATTDQQIDPETGEVLLDPQQASLGLGDAAKPVNYEIAVPMRKGADGKPHKDWQGWAEAIYAALKGLASRAEVEAMRLKNGDALAELFRSADPTLANEIVAAMADREDELQ